MKFKHISILFTSALLSFLFSNTVIATNTDIVINEIAATEKTNCEWVEIYNKGSESVNLQNWKFWEQETNHGLKISSSSLQTDWNVEPGEYAIITQDDEKLFSPECGNYTVPIGTVFDSSWAALSESGEEIGLKDASGEFLEKFVYIGSTNNSLQRKSAIAMDYTSANWSMHTNGNSFGAVNEFSADPADHGNTEPATPTTTNDNISTTQFITINEFLPDPQTGEEWVELYNSGDSSVDLTGWTLYDGVGVIYSPTSTITAHGFFVVELASSKLNNSGDLLVTKNQNDVIVDSVAYGDWNDGNVNDNAPGATKGNTINRKIDGGDSNVDKDDFVESVQTSKGSANAIVAPAVPQTSANNGSSQSGSGTKSSVSGNSNQGNLVINEIFFAAETGTGFVEIYNKTSKVIDTNGWWLRGADANNWSFNGAVIAAKKYYVFEITKIKLGSGYLQIQDAGGNVVDSLVYGIWDNGSVSDNAPAWQSGIVLGRDNKSGDTNNNKYDFFVLDAASKGAVNIFSAAENSKINRNPEIVVNELLPNPTGTDKDNEFIEIKNISAATLNLKNWVLTNEGKSSYEFPDLILEAKKIFVLTRAKSKIVLQNDTDKIKLSRPDNSLEDEVLYKNAAEGISFSRFANKWQWSLKPTPGAENIYAAKNEAPSVVIDAPREVAVNEEIYLDATDTVDANDDKLYFVWNFGDGEIGFGETVTHTFKNLGKFTTALSVGDGQTTSTTKITVTVKGQKTLAGANNGIFSTNASLVKINEFFPNPEPGVEEFVELVNNGDDDIDLGEYYLDDEDGGSKPFKIPAGSIIEAGGYLVFPKSVSGLALNNTGDEVRILDSNRQVLDSVRYGTAARGLSYANSASGWNWTSEITEGEANVIKLAVTGQATMNKKSGKSAKQVFQVAVSDVVNYDVGDKVKIIGAVAALPGMFSSQYFYVANTPDVELGGVQVYMSKKNFPLLKIGDQVAVVGEISEVSGEKRIKTKEKADILVMNKNNQDLTVPTSTISDGEDRQAGGLIKITGEVTQVHATEFYVDDGTGEIRVVLKKSAGVEKENLMEGDMVEVTGIFKKDSNGLILWPRQQSDLLVLNKNSVSLKSSESSKSGASAKYLYTTLLSLPLLLATYFYKIRSVDGREKIIENTTSREEETMM